MAGKQVKLPKVEYLREISKRSRPFKGEACTIVMQSMLNCWASYSEGAPECAKLLLELEDCVKTKMDVKGTKTTKFYSSREIERFTKRAHD